MARKKSEGASSGAVPPTVSGETPGPGEDPTLASPAADTPAPENDTIPDPETPAIDVPAAAASDEPPAPAPEPESPAEPADAPAAETPATDPFTPFSFEPTPAEPPAADEPDGAESVERVEPANPWAPRSDDEPVADFRAADTRDEEADPRAEESREADAALLAGATAAAAAMRDQPEPAEDDLHDEEHGWSFAARALAAIVLLFLGAGIGLWAAPRLAPMLPSGMSGVAAWLTPGASDAQARVDALETTIAGLRAEIAALPDASAIGTEAQGAIEALRTDLAGQIDGLRQDLAGAAAGDVGDRVGRLETTLAGVTTELSTRKGQIETATAGGAAALGADAQQGLDTYRAELEGLKTEVGRLSGSVSGLGARFDSAEAAAEARVTEAEARAASLAETASAATDHAALRADLATIRGAIANGQPFAEPVARLAQDGAVAVPPGLAAAAETGVATPSALRASFGPAAHQAIRASIEAGSGEGVMARARAFLDAQVASRSLAPREGADPDAVLSRVEDALRRDDLATALAEADRLPSEAKAALADWTAAARKRADALAGLAELDAAAAPAVN